MEGCGPRRLGGSVMAGCPAPPSRGTASGGANDFFRAGLQLAALLWNLPIGQPSKDESLFIEMRRLLHEKIQLYIYKPSINYAVDAIAGNLSHLQHIR